VDFPRLSK